MILLKSELKAKGCFPTALNFLFQCQRLHSGAAGSEGQGSLPLGSAPGDSLCAALLPQCHQKTVTRARSDQLLTQASGREETVGSEKGSGALLDTRNSNFHWRWCDISVIPGRVTHRKSGSCSLAWWHESAFSWHICAYWMLPIFFFCFSGG